MKFIFCTIVLSAIAPCAFAQSDHINPDLVNFFGLRPPRSTTKRFYPTSSTTPGYELNTDREDDGALESTTSSTTTPKKDILPQDVLLQCGRRKIEHVGLITSGSSTLPGDWPWHTAIYRVETKGASQKYICGGTLISRNKVVTAGHCVVENGAKVIPQRLTVYFGKHDLIGGDEGVQQKRVFEIELHPKYNFSTLNNDVAILTLTTTVSYTSYVQPICLWDDSKSSKNSIVDELGVIVGWGYTENDVLSTKLMMATLPVIDDWDCIASDSDFFSVFLNRNTFCAGYLNGTSACNGDSGGGMYFPRMINGRKHWYLRGIVSLSARRFDTNLCDPNHYAIFTDVARYLDFIDVR